MMPERPKQASYASKYETRQAVSSTVAGSSSKVKSISLSRGKPSHPQTEQIDARRQPQSLGRMVQYQNIDDIPDGLLISLPPRAELRAEDRMDDDSARDRRHSAASKAESSSHSREENIYDDRFGRQVPSSSHSSHRRSFPREEDQEEGDSDDESSRSSQMEWKSTPQSYSSPIAPLPMLPAEMKAAKKPISSSSSRSHERVKSTSASIIPQQSLQANYPPSLEYDDQEEGSDEVWTRYPLPSQLRPVPALPCESSASYDIVPQKQEVTIDPEEEKRKLFFSKEPRKVEYK